MTKEEAITVLGLPNESVTEAEIKSKYNELFNEFQIRLTNAPTPNLKRLYQKSLQELSEARDVLLKSQVVNEPVSDLPSEVPIFIIPEQEKKGQVISKPSKQILLEVTEKSKEKTKEKKGLGVNTYIFIALAVLGIAVGVYFLSAGSAIDKAKDYCKQENYEQAMKWLRKAAEARDAEAEYIVGLFYYEGSITKDKSNEWYVRATANGDIEAKWINLLYSNPEGITADYNQSFKWFIKAANQELRDAEGQLGVMYSNGTGVTQDYNQAMKWFQKAADKDLSEAELQIGFFYSQGYGVTKDNKKAMEWFQKAADKGNALAMADIGISYMNGTGVSQDYNKAMEWEQKAANKGSVVAMDIVGYLYSNGKGVRKDYSKAFEWEQKAADKGNVTAMKSLSNMYLNGYGVQKDKSKALYWDKKFKEANGNGTNSLTNSAKPTHSAPRPDTSNMVMPRDTLSKDSNHK